MPDDAENILMDNVKKGNPRAVIIRVGAASSKVYSGQKRHDMRIGAQPKYVDAARRDRNRTLIEYAKPADLQAVGAARRELRRTTEELTKEVDKATQDRDEASAEARLWQQRTADLREAMVAVAHETAAGTMFVRDGAIVADDPSALRCDLSEMGPVVQAAARLGTRLAKQKAKLHQEIEASDKRQAQLQKVADGLMVWIKRNDIDLQETVALTAICKEAGILPRHDYGNVGRMFPAKRPPRQSDGPTLPTG